VVWRESFFFRGVRPPRKSTGPPVFPKTLFRTLERFSYTPTNIRERVTCSRLRVVVVVRANYFARLEHAVLSCNHCVCSPFTPVTIRLHTVVLTRRIVARRTTLHARGKNICFRAYRALHRRTRINTFLYLRDVYRRVRCHHHYYYYWTRNTRRRRRRLSNIDRDTWVRYFRSFFDRSLTNCFFARQFVALAIQNAPVKNDPARYYSVPRPGRRTLIKSKRVALSRFRNHHTIHERRLSFSASSRYVAEPFHK